MSKVLFLSLFATLASFVGSATALTAQAEDLRFSQLAEGYWIYIGPGEDPVGDILHRWRWSETGEIKETYSRIEPPAPISELG